MQTTYRRFGKTRKLPSTRQVKHELRYGFFPSFSPLSAAKATAPVSVRPAKMPEDAATSEKAHDLSRWESEGGHVSLVRPSFAPRLPGVIP